MRGMFDMEKLLPPPSKKKKEYHKIYRDTRYMDFKEDIICKEIKDVLPVEIQEEVEEKDHNYYTIPTEDWIDLLGNSEAKDDRRRTDFE